MSLMNKSIIAFLNVISTAEQHGALSAIGEGIKQFNGIISTDEQSLQDAFKCCGGKESKRERQKE